MEFPKLNLEAPSSEPALAAAGTPATTPVPTSNLDPAKLAEVTRRAQEILKAGIAPERLFLCQQGGGTIFVRSPENQPMLPLFTSAYAARDYMRVTGAGTGVGTVKLENLPQLAHYQENGAETFTLNRCPRCRVCLASPIEVLKSREGFLASWAVDRATKSLHGEILVRTVMKYLSAHSPAQARAALEQIRDHINCGVPYVHQMIGFIAGMQGDEPAKRDAAERLKEFIESGFTGTVDFSIEALAQATVGLMINFDIPMTAPQTPE
jgi:hypothetical protein